MLKLVLGRGGGEERALEHIVSEYSFFSLKFNSVFSLLELL